MAPSIRLSIFLVLLWTILATPQALAVTAPEAMRAALEEDLRFFASLGDRSTGTRGASRAADTIHQRLQDLNLGEVGRQKYLTPVRRHEGSTMTLPSGQRVPLNPVRLNAVTPQTVPEPGMTGPLIYAGGGTLAEMNGKPVRGAVVVMELESGRNWLNAAMLGAAALIYVHDGPVSRGLFEDKVELSPVQFPRFLMQSKTLDELFPGFADTGRESLTESVRIVSDISWQRVEAENIYCLVPGTDPAFEEQLVIVETFYDSTAHEYGNAPGADEASSIAAFLRLAEELAAHPPMRPVLLAATAGHAQGQSGLREFVWAVSAKGKYLRDLEREQKNRVGDARAVIDALRAPDPVSALAQKGATPLKTAVDRQLKDEVDAVTSRLMRLRLLDRTEDQELIRTLADARARLRQLQWAESYENLSREAEAIIREMLPAARREYEAILKDAKTQLACIESSRELRAAVAPFEISAAVSLYLSSHGEGVGAFNNRGFMFDIRPDRNYNPAFSMMSGVLERAAPQVHENLGLDREFFFNALRPSRVRPWHTYFLDRPFMGGELTSLGGYVGISLATVNDARSLWGTSDDTPERVDFANLSRQAALCAGLVQAVTDEEGVLFNQTPRLGFGTLDGRASFIRQGELFPDQPAPGTLLQVYQGDAIFYAMTDTAGQFRLSGVGYKKVILGKAIIEGYRFDPETGEILWAIDKNQTGKDAYRVKMTRLYMTTHLTMFAARQMTMFNMLEPRTFRYMTRINLYDGRRDAEPRRYWYSRIDTWDSTLLTFFLEPAVPLKLTLSDSVLNRKLILTNGTPEDPAGEGYLPSQWPRLTATEFRVAHDMWTLLEPRIDNLETHGIVNDRIRSLRQEGIDALARAETALEERRYDTFMENARSSWSLASRVYNDVEATQKDVLIGVLFYIALFVPFAYCAERLLFNFTNIHKRIAAFLGVLLAVIFVIYQVHPAFELTYSPMVVILAFFILGLSVLVSTIIFLRFEREMANMQRRTKRGASGEVSKWRAFGSAFVIGVSNLRRRKIRTALTCVTLIILTFTIMSFTAVKSVRQSGHTDLGTTSPYQGLLFKNLGWKSLPDETYQVIANRFSSSGLVGPRVWVTGEDETTTLRIPIERGLHRETAEGLVGLSPEEPAVTGFDRVLVRGRWFRPDEDNVAVIPARMAERLGIRNLPEGGIPVVLWGMDFHVVGIFDGERMEAVRDLDDEPLTPVTFPSETVMEMSEAEIDAMESDEDALESLQSRYQHVPGELTVIIPAATALRLGGELMAVAVKPAAGEDVQSLARAMVDRFGLMLFSGGPSGSRLYHAADAIDYSGVPNILVPLVIAVLIVLNTMISSVYERKREIAVYTSVGMAPTHVSFLFIAEAVAFAVLSVVLGYLLAQSASQFLSHTPLWSGMTANYSSLAGVAAMALVIGVVLISVIYPSRVAGEIAIPDVNRSWTMPEPENDEMVVTLPFLLKHEEQHCVGGFLVDYYKAHEDISHGMFSSDDLGYEFACPMPAAGEDTTRESGPACLNLSVRIWLAPFDFGVKQRVQLIFCPSADHPEFLEIQVRLKREAGEVGAWKRINKGFLNDLRKQLLVWRSLDQEDRVSYEKLLAAMPETTGIHTTATGGRI